MLLNVKSGTPSCAAERKPTPPIQKRCFGFVTRRHRLPSSVHRSHLYRHQSTSDNEPRNTTTTKSFRNHHQKLSRVALFKNRPTPFPSKSDYDWRNKNFCFSETPIFKLAQNKQLLQSKQAKTITSCPHQCTNGPCCNRHTVSPKYNHLSHPKK